MISWILELFHLNVDTVAISVGVLAGVAGVAGVILGITRSHLVIPLVVISIGSILVGTWFNGKLHAERNCKEVSAALQIKVDAAELKSKQINTEIVDRVVTKIKIVKDVQYVNKNIVETVVAPQIDQQCSLPVSAVELHNSASRNEVSSGPRATDGSSSNVKASSLLGQVVDNYGTCYVMREQLLGWQEWYTQQQQNALAVK